MRRALGAVAALTAVTLSVRHRLQHKPERILEAYYRAWADGDGESLEELVAGDYCGHVHALAGVEDRGREELGGLVESHAEAFDDIDYEVRDTLVDGKRIAARVTMRARHRDTGREGAIEGLVILHLSGGRIVEEWSSWDYLGLANQLGLSEGQ